MKDKLNSPFAVISKIESVNTSFKVLYDKQIRHYKLREHTYLVLSEFFKYFNAFPLPLEEKKGRAWFKYLLALHDIGKAISSGGDIIEDKYIYTKELVNQIASSLNIENELELILALLEFDSLGEYFRGKANLNSTVRTIEQQSSKAKVNLEDYFRLKFIYYQCDLASYTEDAGGIKFLEYLFEYDGGNKKINSNEQRIGFSKKYEKSLGQLERKLGLQ